MSRAGIETSLEELRSAFLTDLASAEDPAAVERVRTTHLGGKAPIKGLLKGLGAVAAEERPAVAQLVQAVQREIEDTLTAKKVAIEAAAVSARLEAEWTDLSVPGIATPAGSEHPVSAVERRCMELMRRLGFVAVEGPEVETPFYNFDALNIPEHHPARDMQDTFWLQGGQHLLRSHTTTVQARVLEDLGRRQRAGEDVLPMRVVSLGRVYRNEAVDATHLAMFHQFEGIWVDRGLTFAHLKGTLAFVVGELFGKDRRIRFKPKFYPYTEPSVGVDVACVRCDGAGCEACHGAGWVTILGAGMIHPKVFRTFGFDPAEVTGIAFGLGTTRMAAQWAGVSKVRSMYEGDLRVHAALSRGQ